MKRVLSIFVVGVIFCSCKATFNGQSMVGARTNKEGILLLDGKPYTGSKDSFLLLYNQHLVIDQPKGEDEMRLAALKRKRKALILGHNSFKEIEDVSVFKKQTVGMYKGKWLRVLHSEDEELTYSSLRMPERF